MPIVTGFVPPGSGGWAADWAGVGAGPLDLTLFALGWSLGWFLLWSPRTLPRDERSGRAPVAVVIPARNEAHAIGHLLAPLVEQRRAGDRIVVVDDHSTDATADVASRYGVDVIVPPEPPPGWLGKPNACSAGADATGEDVLVFLDADVRPGPTLLDDVAGLVTTEPDVLVSVQPWHRMETAGEQVSLLCNVTTLMGCGAFTPLGDGPTAHVAFGPVIAVARSTYDRVGGHGAPAVRSKHTEDIALGRAVGRTRLFVGTPSTTTFRMYPGGLTEAVRGWTRSLATGARFTRWWLALATAAWVCAISGGWLVAPVTYPLIALQLWVLGRRAGTTTVLGAILFPLLLVAFVTIFVRSALMAVLGRNVSWKGRAVDPRGG